MIVRDALVVAKSACMYLAKQVQKDGQFVYIRSDEGQQIDHVPYNMLRHCGAVWAMGSYLDVDDNVLVRESCLNALAFAKSEIIICSSPEADTELLFVLDKKKFAKLGGNALAYLAFDIMAEQEPRMKSGLLAGINFFFANDGSVKFSKFNPHTGAVDGFISEYYPGEAALALCVADEHDAAYRVMTMLRCTRDKSNIVQDHWLMQALELMVKHHLEIQSADSEQIIQFCLQYFHDIYQQIFAVRSYLGRNTPVACRAEGILSYIAALHAVSDVKNYIGARVFLRQLMQELVTYQVKDGAIAGAFLDHNTARIDYTQHSLSVFTRYIAYHSAGVL